MKHIFNMQQMKYLFFLLALVGQCACTEKEPLRTGLEGKPMPVFNLLLADSTTYFSSATIPTDKPSVIYFFSSTCPYCRAQMKVMIRDDQFLKDSHLYLVTNSSLADVKAFGDRFQLDQYPSITIGLDTANLLQRHYNIGAVPYLAVFNKQKKLTRVFEGKTSVHEMADAMKL